MAITAFLYDNFPLNAFSKKINDMSSADTLIKVALYASTYTPDQASHTSWNDFDAASNEVTGAGYTAGGVALTSKTLTAATRVTIFNALKAAWANTTLSADGAIIYDATPAGDTDKKLIACIAFGQTYTTSGTPFELLFDLSGVFGFTVA